MIIGGALIIAGIAAIVYGAILMISAWNDERRMREEPLERPEVDL
jgi:hypothetical protein